MNYFDEYTSGFDMNNIKTKNKYEHSYRVQDLTVLIAKQINLKKEDIYLAKIIGLLHDIGRFEQIKKTNSFSDLEGFDHAEYGVKILFTDNLIAKFNIDSKYYEIINKAIRNHNKYAIEANLNEKELIHAKLIRDADKIDILNLFANFKTFTFEKELGKVSEKVKTDFFKQKQICRKDIITMADKLIMLFAFIYDINFDCSLKIIKENKYYEKILNHLDNAKCYQDYYETLIKYIDERTD